jgi:hypothetical protein
MDDGRVHDVRIVLGTTPVTAASRTAQRQTTTR